jgi:hypothetical protein
MIDRCNCLSQIRRTWNGKIKFLRRIQKNKPGIFIWVSDCSTDIKPALASIKFWCRDVNLDIVKTIKFIHADRKNNDKDKFLKQAYRAGKTIAQKLKS